MYVYLPAGWFWDDCHLTTCQTQVCDILVDIWAYPASNVDIDLDEPPEVSLSVVFVLARLIGAAARRLDHVSVSSATAAC